MLPQIVTPADRTARPACPALDSDHLTHVSPRPAPDRPQDTQYRSYVYSTQSHLPRDFHHAANGHNCGRSVIPDYHCTNMHTSPGFHHGPSLERHACGTCSCGQAPLFPVHRTLTAITQLLPRYDRTYFLADDACCSVLNTPLCWSMGLPIVHIRSPIFRLCSLYRDLPTFGLRMVTKSFHLCVHQGRLYSYFCTRLGHTV